MSKTCYICLKEDEVFSVSNEDFNNALTTIFPSMDMNCFRKAVLCIECLNTFKSTCNFTKNAKRNKRKISVMEQNVCQTCTSPVKSAMIYLFDHIENVVPYYEIKEMLDYCSLDLDIEFHHRPAMCNNCWEILKKSYNFIKKCFENEKIVHIKQEKDDGPEQFDQVIIKQEFVDNNECTNNVSKGLSTQERCDSNVVVKQEVVEESVREQLYVKLKREDLHKLKNCKRRSSKTSKIHQCERCKFTSQTLYKYHRHQLKHMSLQECAHNNSLYKCDRCTYKTKVKYSLSRHLKEVHRDNSYKSDSKSDSKNCNTSHHRQEPNEEAASNTCTICSFVACSKKRLIIHVKMHDLRDVIIKCGQCDFETKEILCLENHKICHKHMQVGKIYKCEKCSYQVKKKTNIDRHVMTHYKKKQLLGKMFSCAHCSYKTKRKDSLPIHIKTQHSVKRRAKR